MWIPPLLILPLLMYNAIYFGLVGGQNLAWASPVFSFSMPSGAVWGLSVGDALVIFALGMLMIDGVRARKAIGKQFGAVIGSGLVFLAYLGEFLLHPAAASSLFFTCLAMSFVDISTRTIFSSRNQPVHYQDE